jgi:hypothetical protein
MRKDRLVIITGLYHQFLSLQSPLKREGHETGRGGRGAFNLSLYAIDVYGISLRKTERRRQAPAQSVLPDYFS